jgi:rhomboid-related protein 1/2/3
VPVPEKGLTDCEESRIVEKLVKERNMPKFVVFQCFMCCFLWLAGMLMTNNLLAGLVSFWPDTMLELTGNSCEEYRPQVYRWLTHQFTHNGVAHLLMNTWMTTILGIPLEAVGGTRRICLLFNLGVLGGSLCWMIGDGHRPVVGASGGVYALLAMHFSSLILNWRQKKFRKPTLFCLLLLIALDVAQGESLGQGTMAVSGTVHVGGFLMGLVAGVAFGRNWEVQRYQVVLQVFCVFIVLAFVVSTLIWVGLAEHGPQNIFEDCGFCWVRQILDTELSGPACIKCGTQECIDYWTNYCSSHFTCQQLADVGVNACMQAKGVDWLEYPGAEC